MEMLPMDLLANRNTSGRFKAGPRPPRFKVGDTVGKLEVVEVLAYEQRDQYKAFQWYRVECDCGAVEEIHQKRLMDGRTDCLKCVEARRTEKKRKKQYEPPPENLPDFARLRW